MVLITTTRPRLSLAGHSSQSNVVEYQDDNPSKHLVQYSRRGGVAASFLHWADLPAKLAAVAVAYYVVGRLGLLLAIPPGYATAVWPASGIALAGTLIFGYRVWPGILLGSFLVNLWT